MIHLPVWLLYALVALVFWGITGVTQKLSTNAISTQLSFLWFVISMAVISLAVAFAVPIQSAYQAARFLAGGDRRRAERAGRPDELRCVRKGRKPRSQCRFTISFPS